MRVRCNDQQSGVVYRR